MGSMKLRPHSIDKDKVRLMCVFVLQKCQIARISHLTNFPFDRLKIRPNTEDLCIIKGVNY